MTEPFVAQLRTRGDIIELASPGGPAITVRVEMPEVWDAVRVHASPDERVLTGTLATIEALLAADPMERTAIIFVGSSLAAEGFGESSLYDAHYQRRFRGRDGL